MRKARGNKKRKEERPDKNSGPLKSLPVDRLQGDQLQRRRSCQHSTICWSCPQYLKEEEGHI